MPATVTHGQRAVSEKELTFFNADLCQIIARRHAELCAKNTVQVGCADVRGIGELL